MLVPVKAVRKSIHSPEYKSLIGIIRRAREANGVSQEQVGIQLRITASQVSKWERMERRLDLTELRLYCNAIGVPLSEIIQQWEQTISHD